MGSLSSLQEHRVLVRGLRLDLDKAGTESGVSDSQDMLDLHAEGVLCLLRRQARQELSDERGVRQFGANIATEFNGKHCWRT